MKRTSLSATAATLALATGLTTLTGAPATAQGPEPADVPRVSAAELVAHYDALAPGTPAGFAGSDNSRLPASLADGFALGSVRVLTASGERAPEHVAGVVDYGTTTGGYGVVAASDGPRADRFGLVLLDPRHREVALDVVLPDGAAVDNEETGEVVVTAPGLPPTTLAPARAVDADGSPVPARYRIVGDQLLVEVDLDDAALPVLVDPATANHWWGFTDWYSRGEVQAYADWWRVVRVVEKACRGFAPCVRLARSYTSWVYGTWQHAKRHNMCLSMSQTWTGQVTGIYAYHCTW
jgi:hypothetical protein